MSTVEVRLRFFGALRDYGSAISVRVPEGTTIGDLKEQAVRALSRDGATDLLRHCAVGNDTEILAESSRIERSCELALLPPVCGG